MIGWAGICLSKLDWIDRKILTTDSAEYASEGEKYGLASPFLRPARLSSDTAGAIDTMVHALLEAESIYGMQFDIILLIEPTSPFRTPKHIDDAALRLIRSGSDSVVTVSELSSKAHPLKVLKVEDKNLVFYDKGGAGVVARQSLGTLYWRNGACYALTRKCLLEKKAIFTDNTLPLIIKNHMVNIDEPIDLEWAEFLMQRGSAEISKQEEDDAEQA